MTQREGQALSNGDAFGRSVLSSAAALAGAFGAHAELSLYLYPACAATNHPHSAPAVLTAFHRSPAEPKPWVVRHAIKAVLNKHLFLSENYSDPSADNEARLACSISIQSGRIRRFPGAGTAREISFVLHRRSLRSLRAGDDLNRYNYVNLFRAEAAATLIK